MGHKLKFSYDNMYTVQYMLHKWFSILYNFLFRNTNSNDNQKKEGKFGEKLTKTRKHREDVFLYCSLGELKTQSVV
jgi:hypothetical protein